MCRSPGGRVHTEYHQVNSHGGSATREATEERRRTKKHRVLKGSLESGPWCCCFMVLQIYRRAGGTTTISTPYCVLRMYSVRSSYSVWYMVLESSQDAAALFSGQRLGGQGLLGFSSALGLSWLLPLPITYSGCQERVFTTTSVKHKMEREQFCAWPPKEERKKREKKKRQTMCPEHQPTPFYTMKLGQGKSLCCYQTGLLMIVATCFTMACEVQSNRYGVRNTDNQGHSTGCCGAARIERQKGSPLLMDAKRRFSAENPFLTPLFAHSGFPTAANRNWTPLPSPPLPPSLLRTWLLLKLISLF